MIAALAAAALLGGPGDPCVIRAATIERTEYGPPALIDAESGGIARYLYSPGPVAVAGGPAEPPADCLGRRAWYCEPHSAECGVNGGKSPADWAAAVAEARSIAGFAGPIAPGRPPTRDEALVRVGLASGSWATRTAAHRALVARGAAALPALLGGLESADAEVRVRCEMIADMIHFGPEIPPVGALPDENAGTIIEN